MCETRTRQCKRLSLSLARDPVTRLPPRMEAMTRLDTANMRCVYRRSYLIDERQQHQRQSGRHERCIEYYSLPRSSHHNSATRRQTCTSPCHFVQHALYSTPDGTRRVLSRPRRSRTQRAATPAPPTSPPTLMRVAWREAIAKRGGY